MGDNSADLALEIKKGLTQKAEQGDYPHGAPLGYLNLREVIAGRQVARIVPDPERAALITAAFDLYATGEWTLQRLAGELAHLGLTNRGIRGRQPGRHSKGRCTYFFCLGQKNDPAGTCRERYIAASDLEAQIEDLTSRSSYRWRLRSGVNGSGRGLRSGHDVTRQ